MFMRILTIIFIVLIAILGAFFALLNGDLVAVKYYFGEVHSPLSLVIGITFLFGLAIGIFANLFFVIKLRFENRSLKKQIKKDEEEIAHLRTSPFESRE